MRQRLLDGAHQLTPLLIRLRSTHMVVNDLRASGVPVSPGQTHQLTPLLIRLRSTHVVVNDLRAHMVVTDLRGFI